MEKNDNNNATLRWINIGIVCGFLVSFIYPALQFISDLLMGVILGTSMGILLSLASVGIYYFIQLHNKTIISKIAVFSNIIAGVILTQMILVQLAIRASRPEILDETGRWVWSTINHIHYGLDVAWDVYIFLGTILFAINSYRHPKLGKIISVIGIVISILFIVTNIITFPIAPERDLMDFGPFIGLWYLVVTIKISLSGKWVKQQLV
jgi:hypothetical protein